jgi:hypothetical protein
MRPILLVAAIAIGCTSTASSSGTPPEENTTDPPAADSSTPPQPQLAHDAGKPPPPPPPPNDGGTIDGGANDAADAGDPTSIASLFPVVVGHSWTFQVSSDFPECDGERTGSVLRQEKVDGRDAVWISSYCEGQSPAAVALSDKSADVDIQGHYVPQLAEPVADGTKFQSIMGTTTWHNEGTVTVPAGAFQNCWRASSGASFVIYCPGAGTVHIYEDHGDGVIDAVLKKKNF